MALTLLEKKAMTLMAKYQALSNAAEMIGQHGEEGFSFDDDKFNKVYLREAKKLKNQLNNRASKMSSAYLKTGIIVNTNTDNWSLVK